MTLFLLVILLTSPTRKEHPEAMTPSRIAAATATKPAIRGKAVNIGPTGLNGMSLAPAGLSECDEMTWYRVQAGLPSRFDGIGWRESNCKNNVRTWCCYGYWQNFLSSHLRGAYRKGINEVCQVFVVSDIYGTLPLQKQKQACVTKIVYDISGTQPWALTR